jgi:nicotinic acid phosphoribosyltransferase
MGHAWDCVTGAEEEPENRDLAHAFRRSDRKAYAILQSAIAPNLIQVVKDCRTSRETFDALKEHFGDTSLSNKVYINRCLFKLQQDEIQNCLDLTAHIVTMTGKLSQMNFLLSPIDSVIVLLASLHPGLDQWVEQTER